jgi:hypothetical protein
VLPGEGLSFPALQLTFPLPYAQEPQFYRSVLVIVVPRQPRVRTTDVYPQLFVQLACKRSGR